MASPADIAVPSVEKGDVLKRILIRIEAERKRRGVPKAKGKEVSPFLGDRPRPTEPTEREGFDLGIQKEARRQKVRAWVDSLPPTLGFLVEMSPSIAGTIVGALFGNLPGAVGGGVIGEGIGQNIGVTPWSDAGLILSGGGPVAGKVIGGMFKTGRKAVAGAAKGLAPARVALAKNLMRKAAVEFESIGTKILSAQQGIMRTPTDVLYQTIDKYFTKIRIPAFDTTKTRASFAPLRKELEKFKALDDVRQAMNLLDDLEQTMRGSSVSFSELISSRQIVGVAIQKAQNATKGSKRVKGALDQFYKAVSKDIDYLASRGGKTGLAAKMAQAAGKRAKLDFAVKDMEKAAAQYTVFEEGTNVLRMNVGAYRKWFRNATNPKSKDYKKDMTDALGDQVDGISDRLRILTEFTEVNPAGPGSIVVRGIGAATGAGIGSLVAGAPGAVVGALVGVRAPEMLTAILSSPRAITFLQKATELGKRPMTRAMWETAGQIAAQGIKVNEPGRGAESEVNTPQRRHFR